MTESNQERQGIRSNLPTDLLIELGLERVRTVGIVLVVLGAAALIAPAVAGALVSLIVGIVLLAAGLSKIVRIFRTKSWKRHWEDVLLELPGHCRRRRGHRAAACRSIGDHAVAHPLLRGEWIAPGCLVVAPAASSQRSVDAPGGSGNAAAGGIDWYRMAALRPLGRRDARRRPPALRAAPRSSRWGHRLQEAEGRQRHRRVRPDASKEA